MIAGFLDEQDIYVHQIFSFHAYFIFTSLITLSFYLEKEKKNMKNATDH